MPDINFPVLHTSRLSLVELQPQHAPAFFRLMTDVRVTEFYFVHDFEKEEDLRPVIGFFETQFEAGKGIRWGITLQGSEDIIGTIGYRNIIPGHKGTVLFALMPEYHNKGYITEALTAIVQFGTERLGLRRIEAEVRPGNIASKVVLKKAGFTYEGLLRQWVQWNGQHYDMEMYSLINKG